MLVDMTSLNQPIRHASCVPDYSSSPPLSCQENTTNTCSQVPRVSCFLPGYKGCYRSTDDNPYFTITPPQLFEQTLQDCGRDCYSLGHQFFGVTGSRCRCSDSNEPSEGEELGTIACQTRCQGDPDQICGGTNAVSVYEVEEFGEKLVRIFKEKKKNKKRKKWKSKKNQRRKNTKKITIT
nr:kremen protein 1-like [Lytechinus pictus]